MQLKLIIFDVDGLILDSERLWKRAWQIVGEQYGYENLGMDVFHRIVGLSGLDEKKVLRDLLSQYGDYDTILGAVKIEGAKLFENELALKSGVLEILDYLKVKDLQLAVATSSTYQQTITRLSRVGVWDYFDFVICGDQVEKRKPNPEIYLKVLDNFSLNAQEAIVLEDSLVGVEAAYNANIPCIMVPDLIEARDIERERTIAIVEDLIEAKQIIAGVLNG